MKWILLLLLLSCCSMLETRAQANYDASLISKDLLPYASAVVRDQETTVEVKAKDKVLTDVKSAITVLNKNGDRAAEVVIWHNSASTIIRSIKGVIYNAAGIQIGKFGKNDFKDVYAAPDYDIFYDSRVMTYMPAITDYPYTIAYEYETQSNQSLSLPDWRPNGFPGLAVEKSTFTFICKPDFEIKYNEVNLPSKVIAATTKDGLKSYTWTLSNLKAIRPEPFSPPKETYLSNVEVSPESFIYNGVRGDYTDWASFGKWVYDQLLTGRTVLPESTVSAIKKLTGDITDPKLKAKKIYEYMQQKTRYVSIQMGIGTLQPMAAFDVDRLNYGDCKGLVNYMQALLKAADIESWYCVVQAGSPRISIQTNFASAAQGNHIILCVPFKNDTTWLECTNQQMPFGFLSDFTDNRLVLACTAQGGKLLHTPRYTPDVNQQIRKANFVINEHGELSGDMETVFKGVQYDERESYILKSQTDRVKDLKDLYTINNLEIENLSFKQDKAIEPAITENIKLTASDYAALSNNNFYFTINPVNRVSGAPRELRTRTTPLYINNGYIDEDEITYKIPAGYKLAKEPLNVHLNKPFGAYDATITTEDGKLVYKRKIKMIDGTYSKDMYQDFVDFYQAMADADSYNAILVKKTN